MSIPASIAISKIRVPELEEPVTRGRVVVDRGVAGPCRPDPLQHTHNPVTRGDIQRLAHLDWPRIRHSPFDAAARPTIRLLSYHLLPWYVHVPIYPSHFPVWFDD